jgi:hypothetical protein
MTARAYRKPGWWQRTIANRLAPRLAPRRVATLSVRGRRSGQCRTVPVVVLEHEGQRYLLTPLGTPTGHATCGPPVAGGFGKAAGWSSLPPWRFHPSSEGR